MPSRDARQSRLTRAQAAQAEVGLARDPGSIWPATRRARSPSIPPVCAHPGRTVRCALLRAFLRPLPTWPEPMRVCVGSGRPHSRAIRVAAHRPILAVLAYSNGSALPQSRGFVAIEGGFGRAVRVYSRKIIRFRTWRRPRFCLARESVLESFGMEPQLCRLQMMNRRHRIDVVGFPAWHAASGLAQSGARLLRAGGFHAWPPAYGVIARIDGASGYSTAKLSRSLGIVATGSWIA